jgi:hypothetical protein
VKRPLHLGRVWPLPLHPLPLAIQYFCAVPWFMVGICFHGVGFQLTKPQFTVTLLCRVTYRRWDVSSVSVWIGVSSNEIAVLIVCRFSQLFDSSCVLRGVDEVFTLLGCYAAYFDSCSPTFRDSQSVPSPSIWYRDSAPKHWRTTTNQRCRQPRRAKTLFQLFRIQHIQFPSFFFSRSPEGVPLHSFGL